RVVWSMCLHPTEPGTLYVGTEHTSIFRTRDGGATWRQLPVPEPQGMIRQGFPMRVVRIALDPVDPGTVYAAMEVGGVVRSLDGGDSWADCNTPLLAMAQQERLKSSIISDVTHEGMLDSHAVTTSPTHPGALHLANRMGIFLSEDRGDSWAEIGIGRFSPLTYTRDVQVSPHDPETMYAALSIASISDAGSLYRSRDYGRSWQRFDHGVSIDSTLMTIAQSPTSPQRVWCGARRGQVFGTEDGGQTWSTHPLPRVEGIYAIGCS
ncbi:MAG: WD40/YVTN/BNR-like repeat-containing protein, partial [Alphaproteobacteria bacterium]